MNTLEYIFQNNKWNPKKSIFQFKTLYKLEKPIDLWFQLNNQYIILHNGNYAKSVGWKRDDIARVTKLLFVRCKFLSKVRFTE